MRARAKFPALIHGRTTKMRGDKLVFCLPEIDFEVPEIVGADAPIAVVTDSYDGVTPYRYFDGKLYTPLKDGEILTKLTRDADVTVLREGHPVFGGMVAEVRNIIGFARDGSETRPERLYNVLNSYRLDDAIAIRAAMDAVSLVETPTTLEALASWATKATARLSEFLLIDGQAWQASPEPCYRLDTWSGIVEVDPGEVFRVATGSAVRPHGWDKLSSRYYSALDEDLLAGCVGRMVFRNRTDTGTMDVLMPEALTTNFRDREIDRFARICVAKVEEYIGTELRKNKDALRDAPADLLLSAAVLRDRLAWRDPSDDVSHDLAEALFEHGTVLSAYPQVTHRMNFEEQNVVCDVATEWLGDVVTRLDRPMVPVC
jgi:hypothetical protein